MEEAETLVVTVQDISGGRLWAAAEASLCSHCSALRQVALPDGSVVARLPLRAVLLKHRAAQTLAVAHLLLVDAGSDTAALRAAADACERSQATPWAVLYLLTKPHAVGEESLTEVLRGLPPERLARATLDGARLTSTAQLDAQLGECVRQALSCRSLALRETLARASEAGDALGAAEAWDQLASLLEAAVWPGAALEVCDAAFIALHKPPLLQLPEEEGDVPLLLGTLSLSVPRWTAPLLRQRLFTRLARLLKASGEHAALAARGLACLRSAAACMPPHARGAWTYAAALQLADALGELTSAAWERGELLALCRRQLVAAGHAQLAQPLLSALRGDAGACAATAGVGAEAAAAALRHGAHGRCSGHARMPARALHDALASTSVFEGAWLALSVAAACAMRAGGQPRRACAWEREAAALLRARNLRGAAQLCAPSAALLGAEGWGMLLGARCCLAEQAQEGPLGALALLAFPAAPGSATDDERAAALDALDASPLPEGAPSLDCSSLLWLSPAEAAGERSSDAEPPQVVRVRLHLAAAAPLTLHSVRLQLLAPSQPSLQCLLRGAQDVVTLQPGDNTLAFEASLDAADAAPGHYLLAGLIARLNGGAAIAVKPRRWCSRGASRQPPLALPPWGVVPPAAGGPSRSPRALLVLPDGEAALSLSLVLLRGALSLGAPLQWLGIRICAEGAPLRASALALSGGAGLDVPTEQEALLWLHSGGALQPVAMREGALPLPPLADGSRLVAWVRVLPTAGGAHLLRVEAVVRSLAQSGAAHVHATSLTAPAAPPFAVTVSRAHLAGVAGGCSTALQVCITSQLHGWATLRALTLLPTDARACGVPGCCCVCAHEAGPTLPLPCPLPPKAQLAALFLLQPCAARAGRRARLQVRYSLDDRGEAEAEGAAALPPAGQGEAVTWGVAVALPDAPLLHVSAAVPEAGRVGECLRFTFRVEGGTGDAGGVHAAAPARAAEREGGAACVLRWRLRAPPARWLLLGAGEGTLTLPAEVAVDCVPARPGELPAPELELSWAAEPGVSGREPPDVWAQPPSLVRVLPQCE